MARDGDRLGADGDVPQLAGESARTQAGQPPDDVVAARQISDRQFRVLVEQSPVSIAVVEMDGTIAYLNGRAVETFGYLREDIPVMERWWERAYPDASYRAEVRARWTGSLERAMTLSQEIERGEYRVTCKDGTVKTTVIFGVIVGSQVCVMFEDITARRQAEEEHTRQRQDQYRMVLQTAMDGFWLVDLQGRLMEVNDTYCGMSGYSEQELLTMHVPDVEVTESSADTAGHIQRVITQGEDRFESRHRRKDGSLFDVEVSVHYRASDGGRLVTFLRDISDSKRAEETLRESEERYRGLFDESIAAICVFDAHKRFVNANPAALDLLGYSREELLRLGMPDVDVDPDVVLPAHQTLLSGGRLINYAHTLRRKDGTVITVLNNSSPITDRHGNVVGMLSNLIDITARKQAEEALRESEARYRQLVDNTDTGFVVVGEDGIVTMANEPYRRLVGASGIDGLVGHSVIEWTAPEERENNAAAVALCVRQGFIEDFETVYQRGDGTRVDVLINATAQLLPGGGKQLAALCRDITERKRAEAALRESDAQHRELFESSADATFLLVADTGQVIEANARASALYGYDREELLSKRNTDLSAEPDETDQRTQEASMALGQIQGIPLRLHRKKDGTVFPVDLISRAFVRRGQLVLLVTVRDITERKRAEQEKFQLETQLQQAQKLESVGRLAGGVAHDFNNMLAVILGHSELAFDRLDASHPAHRHLLQIEKAAGHSAELTNQLLAFARRQTIAPKVLDLNERVTAILKMLQRLIGEDITLHWHQDTGLWPVKIDPTQVDQLLTNLCLNARDAITGVGELTIQTRNTTLAAAEAAPGDYVVLAVSDTGVGMPPETLAHIFEPFFTTKEQGRGTGLGLATVHGIAGQNGGFVTAASELGVGTTVTIYLPRHVGVTVEALAPAAQDAPHAGGETVLVVEDEPGILELATEMLEGQGYTVLDAGTPEEALRLSREHAGEIHLLLTDVVMPAMNGRDLVTQVVALRPGVKSLFMSGYTADVIAGRGVLDADVHFIQKPFTRQALAVKVRQVLDGNFE